MPEKEFQAEVLSQLAEIKTHQRYFSEGLVLIRQHGERITSVEASAKSAHHRISGILLAASSLGAVFGTVANLAISVWSKMGGKG